MVKYFFIILWLTFFVFACGDEITEPQGRSGYKKNFTILIYMDADNNLDSGSDNNYNSIFADINEMEQVGSTEDMDVVLLVDRVVNSSWEKPRIYHIQKDTNLEVVNSIILKKYSYELNMGDSATLHGFIEYGINNFPSEKYILILWSHGSGWYPERINKSLKSSIVGKKIIRSIIRSVGSDVSHNKDGLNLPEIKQALKGYFFETIMFDACFMGGIELAYQLKDISKSIVFSQGEVPTSGFPYHRLLGLIQENPGISSRDFAGNAVNLYYNYIMDNALTEAGQKATISAIDLENISSITNQVNNFVLQLSNNISLISNLSNIAANSQLIDGSDKKILDFYNLTFNIYNDDSISAEAKTKAIALMNKLEQLIINEKHTANGYTVNDYNNIKGVSIFFPTLSESYGTFYYDDSCKINEYRKLDWCKDTLWDELLDWRLK